MKVRPYGDRAVLLELEGPREALAHAAALRGVDGVAEVVPAAQTVLVVGAPGTSVPALREIVSAAGPEAEERRAPGAVVDIEVIYDGEDLDEVSRLTGLAREEVVGVHSGQLWTVAFGGFAPGFGYLATEDPSDARLHVPRRDEPRTRVPAGSVGLAGEHSGIYPTASPGGWQLIGRTDAVLFDIDRDPPALLPPGTRVRFVPREP